MWRYVVSVAIASLFLTASFASAELLMKVSGTIIDEKTNVGVRKVSLGLFSKNFGEIVSSVTDNKGSFQFSHNG